jgi:hypothetical protein
MARKKPTPSTLFDERERDNNGHKKWAESLYGFLNRCAGPEWDEVRHETERWYAEFPEPKRDLLRRFRRKEDEQHLPAWWELYVHRLFVLLGYEVTAHPELPGRKERPDFLVSRGTESLYVEATTVFNGDYKVNPHGQAWVKDYIDSAQNPDFMVDVEFPKVGAAGWPGRKDIVGPLEEWLAGLDWAEARADWDANGMASMTSPRWRWRHECGDWTIAYLATPVRADSRGKTRRLIAIPPTSAANFSRDIEKIRAKLNQKGGNKYSSLDDPLDKPLVVALQLWNHVDDPELMNVLFGSEQFEWLIDNSTGSTVPESIRSIRVPDGYWRPEFDPRGTRISGVLFGNTLSAYSVASKLPELWLNPWASALLPELAPFRTRYVDDGGKFATREATDTAPAVFKLPHGRPNTTD